MDTNDGLSAGNDHITCSELKKGTVEYGVLIIENDAGKEES